MVIGKKEIYKEALEQIASPRQLAKRFKKPLTEVFALYAQSLEALAKASALYSSTLPDGLTKK